MKQSLLHLILVLPLMLTVHLSYAQVDLQLTPVENPFNLVRFNQPERVGQYRLSPPELSFYDQNELHLELRSAEASYQFELSRRNYRSSDFQRTFASGRIDESTRPSVQFYGRVKQASNQRALFTLDRHFTLGYWEADGKNWVLEPLWLTQPAAPKDIYLLFTEDNLKEKLTTCKVVDSGTPAGSGRSRGWIGDRIIDLAVAMDSLMYNQFVNAESAENFILGLLALVQEDYDRGFDEAIFFQLTELYFSDGTDPEPWVQSLDSEELLESYTAWGNQGGFTQAYDMAAIWTGRNIRTPADGSNNIGLAYLNATCGSFRYHVVENWSANTSDLRAIWSHEIGHNLGAQHINGDRWIMNPTLSARNRQWSQQSIRRIESRLPGFTCLAVSPWLTFTAEAIAQNAQLTWSYRVRAENEGFFVERSPSEDGPFTDLAWIPANSNTSNWNYEYADENLTPGTVYYYRLRQINEDGAEYLSPVERVVINYPSGVRISPNPTSSTIRIISEDLLRFTYRITDLRGRVVRTGKAGLGGTDVDLSSLAAGMYLYYELVDDDFRFVTKIIKR